MPPRISAEPIGSDDAPGPVADSDVVFLPAFEADTPIYSAAVPELVAALRAADVSARTWHADGLAEFAATRGPVTEALIQIAVGIASSGGWYAVQSLLERRHEKVHLIAVYEKDGQRFRIEVTGPAPEVARELGQLDPFRVEPPE
ncbi:hypothetical protein Aab01nite_45200 [Paractinoplanes abujensis]|uniref:Uncharacterized protein n=1 Tax=Paractinoplanes abujensis TaxID=882441 RepID=A0A7W7CKB5_9ACTN|nr:hypothetical protein [Actinoplanes abujensis]MBB4690162.1 hypothetical protein [Actinoplanes abujensis]GID20930.1 hypothetical protein Aab01nite_45200 [Actinoplanes abujensis]